MPALESYELGEVLSTGAETQTRFAVHRGSGAQVALKTAVADPPSARVVECLVHEHDVLTQLLAVPGVVRARALERDGGTVALVLESPGFQRLRSLDEVLAERGRLPVETGLRIGREVARTLAGVHAAGLMHKDIKPESVLVDEVFERVLLGNFRIASQLSREGSQEATTASPVEALEGTLAYISPEQTGRTARTLDTRTDLYSLGAMLFELLSGRLPFTERDPLGLVYAHLAREPPALDEVVPDVPKVVAALVATLLAKDPERRYQTARGVAEDLNECLQRMRASGSVPSFALGERDHSPRLRLTEMLVGRQHEAEQIGASFASAADGAVELLLIGGPSGIGKTALVRSVYRDLAQAGRGLLVTGKHDQVARSTPYAALAQGFGALMRQWLASPEPVLEAWKERLRGEVGDNARLIADVVPELDLVMGKLAPVPAVSGEQVLARQKVTWLNFVRAVTTPSAPLVMFLDDMQWADSATLEILKTLVTDVEQKGLLVLVAYRDSETPPEHPLWKLVEAVEKSGAKVSRMTVSPLSEPQVQTWLARTLVSEAGRVEPFSQVLWRKTRGNPFFLEQLLLSLHRQGKVVRDVESRAWRWSQKELEQAQVTDNVVALLTDKVLQMPEATQHLLGLAACAGHTFHLHDLERLSGWERARVTGALWPALHEELVVAADRAYRPAQAQGQVGASGTVASGGVERALDTEYRFLHDRVQQASYERLVPEQRVQAHLEIGRRLWAQRRTHGGTSQRLLELVRHLNLGSARMDSAEERKALALLNGEAARAAKAASSHRLLASLAETAQALLGDDAWHKEPELSAQLELERLEAAYLLREFDDVEARSARLLGMPLPALARLSVQEILVRCYAQSQIARGIEQGRAMLAEHDLVFPDTEEACRVALFEGSAELDQWFEHNPGAFERMPPDPTLKHVLIDAVMMHLMVSAALAGQPMLSMLVIARAVLRVRQRGALTPAAPFIIVCFAKVSSLVTGMSRRAARWVGPGVRAAERLGSPFLPECVSFQGTYTLYSRPVDEVAAIAERTLAIGLKIGSFQGTSWGLEAELLHSRVWRGQPLGQIEARRRSRLALMKRVGTANVNHCFELITSWCELLMTPGRTRSILSEEPLLRGSRSLMADGINMISEVARILEAHLFLVASAYPRALERAREADQFRAALFDLSTATDIPLWLGLAAAKCWHEATDAAERVKLGEHVERGLARFRYLAEGCPENFLHKLRLLEAEYARVQGQAGEAIARYGEAIELAREQRFLHIEALAAQFCAEFHLEAGRTHAGMLYLREARDAYARWDAFAVVAHLEAKYPALLEAAAPAPTAGPAAAASPTAAIPAAGEGAQLDVGTVVRAAQALSSELDPERVAGRLMELVLENAGAQRGALVVCQGEALTVVARLSAEGMRIETGLLEPLEQAQRVAVTAVQYAARTWQPVVLSDAPADACFRADPHLRASEVRSVLAVPLVHRGRLDGILYLEHASPAAFPAARVTLLSMLASHGAIALQNASLYVDLQGQIAERGRAEEALQQQNRILHSVLASIGDGVLVADEGGHLLFVNPAADAMMGTVATVELSPEQGAFHKGLYLPDTVTPYPPERLPLIRAVAGEAIDRDELFLRNAHRPLGAWLRASARPLVDELGARHGGVVVVQDVTEHKWAEGAARFLAEAGRRLATSLEPEATIQHIAELPIPELATASLVCLLDEAQTLVLAASAGLSDAAVSRLRDVLCRGPSEAFATSAVLASGQPSTGEVPSEAAAALAVEAETLCALGLTSWATVPLVARGRSLGLLCLFAPERGRWGGAALGLAEELGRRAALALDNARLYQAAQEAVRMRDEFLIVASHELKTPLTSVVLQMQLLEQRTRRPGAPPLDPQQQRSLALFRRQVDRLVKLADELLDVSRIRAGRLLLQREDVELAALVRDVLARIEG